MACRILVPQPVIKTVAPTVEAWSSKHWVAREFSFLVFFFKDVIGSIFEAKVCSHFYWVSLWAFCHLLLYKSTAPFPTSPFPPLSGASEGFWTRPWPGRFKRWLQSGAKWQPWFDIFLASGPGAPLEQSKFVLTFPPKVSAIQNVNNLL